MMGTVGRYARLWFGLAQPVGRAAYLWGGVCLMALKYAVDVAVVWSYTGRLWTPLDYANPAWTVREQALRGIPAGVLVALGVWTLPFVWVGVSMTARRAADAGYSAWLALLFFVPVVNYLAMAALCFPPSVPRSAWMVAEPTPVLDHRFRSGLLGVAAAVGITIPTVLLSVYWKREYSVGLFVGTPFVIGSVTANIFNWEYARSTRDTLQVVVIAVAVAAGTLWLFAAEGIVCLALAFPLGAGVAIVGGLLGRAIAIRGKVPSGRLGAAALLAPALVLVGPRVPTPVREVVTVMDIAAPPAVVWRNVISFPDLPAPDEIIFRAGVAAPIRARIIGTGVGATRYCDFTTGSFVEPITAWEDGRDLEFAISAQALPMRELSPYRDIHPPHLDGYFRATQGGFRLTPLPGGGTRLEGHTSYELRMGPAAYWSVPADAIVEAIHRRVMNHIRRLSEEKEMGKEQ